MKRITVEDPESRSSDMVAANIRELARLFPDVVAEGKVDFEALRELLGDAVDDGDEKYGLSWHGKRRARQLALRWSTGTLRPSPEESVEWDSTQNMMIEGDNLEVLKLLQRSYTNKVKLIYIDPPYNTGKDFVYRDNYKDGIKNYLKITGQLDGNGDKVCSNTDASGRFHTKWLNMMYPRLKVARTLLRPDGVCFISVDENESARLRLLCDEIFGEENFVCDFIWKKKSGGGGDVGSVVIDHETILCYGRTEEPGIGNDPFAQITTSYNKTEIDGRRYSLDRLDKQSLGYQESLDFPIEGPDGKVYAVEHKDTDHKVARWRWGKSTVQARYGELVFKWPYVYTKNYEKESGAKPRSLLIDERFGRTRTGKADLKALFSVDVMDFPKPVKLMTHLLNLAASGGDIVMDFFAGSCPLGQAVMERTNEEEENPIRFILVQLQEPVMANSQSGRNAHELGCENVAEIGKERLRRTAAGATAGAKTGFRVFKLDSSNIRAWEPDKGDLKQSVIDYVDHIKPDRSEDDLFYELLLKLGYDLCAPMEQREIAGKRVNAVAGGALITCMAESIKTQEVDELTLGIVALRDEMEDTEDIMVFFRDSAFKDEVAKANVTEILRQYGIKDVRSL